MGQNYGPSHTNYNSGSTGSYGGGSQYGSSSGNTPNWAQAGQGHQGSFGNKDRVISTTTPTVAAAMVVLSSKRHAHFIHIQYGSSRLIS